MNLNSPIRELKGVGEQKEKCLQKIGVYSVRDILLHFPYHYIEYPQVQPVSAVIPETIMAIEGKVTATPFHKKIHGMDMVTATITDGHKNLNITWFRQPYIKKQLHPSESYVFYGKIRNKNGRVSMDQPAIYSYEDYEALRQSYQPLYHLSKDITNNAFRKLVQQCLPFIDELEELLPEELRERRSLLSYSEAVYRMHFPKNMLELMEGRKRLVFQEFFRFLLQMQAAKLAVTTTKFKCENADKIYDLMKKLSFELTEGQQQALKEILEDMQSEQPMQRLLQGDVGSGKTILALFAMIFAHLNGYQSAIMAPTEVLARQHYETFLQYKELFGLDYQVYLLTGSMGAKEKREMKEAMKQDKDCLIVGTHALIQDSVDMPNVALVITDEQHRFGVRQRETLSDKGMIPHTLVMSATPIPRTLALILYGDLSISTIKSLPSERLPIKNCVVGTSYRNTAYEFIKRQVEVGFQAYVICPLVEESEAMDGADVISYAKQLQEYYVQTIAVGVLHGKMKPAEKIKVMEDFVNNKIQVLVSTTVIEVGVNVPNATVMMVENAEQFGLAQLHQLRGRIGRGAAQSYCIFIDGKNQKENPRLEILNHSNDGFYIAEKDLELRGPGDFFGIRQSGEMDFVVADIYKDAEILKDAAEEMNRWKGQLHSNEEAKPQWMKKMIQL